MADTRAEVLLETVLRSLLAQETFQVERHASLTEEKETLTSAVVLVLEVTLSIVGVPMSEIMVTVAYCHHAPWLMFHFRCLRNYAISLLCWYFLYGEEPFIGTT